jgi:hypothetical protein
LAAKGIDESQAGGLQQKLLVNVGLKLGQNLTPKEGIHGDGWVQFDHSLGLGRFPSREGHHEVNGRILGRPIFILLRGMFRKKSLDVRSENIRNGLFEIFPQPLDEGIGASSPGAGIRPFDVLPHVSQRFILELFFVALSESQVGGDNFLADLRKCGGILENLEVNAGCHARQKLKGSSHLSKISLGNQS